MFKRINLSIKITAAFGLMALVLALAALFPLSQVQRVSTLTSRSLDQGAPATLAYQDMQKGLSNSLAALQSWLTTGNDSFRSARAQAWQEQIMPSLATLRELRPLWSDSKGKKQLEELGALSTQLKDSEDRIEAMAAEVDLTNLPAHKLHAEQAQPLAEKNAALIAGLISFEGRLEATPLRKQLVDLMARLQNAAALSAAAVESFLHSPEQQFHNQFTSTWRLQEELCRQLLGHGPQLTPEQRQNLKQLQLRSQQLHGLYQQIFSLRQGEKWNRALYLLQTEAVPQSQTLIAKLHSLIAAQKKQLARDTREAKAKTRRLATTEYSLLGGGLLVCLLLAIGFTRMIMGPMRALFGGLKTFSSQELAETGHRMGHLVIDISQHTSEIRDKSSALASAAADQAGSLAPITATLKYLTTVTAATSDKATKANTMATQASEATQNGTAAMERMNEAIQDIKASTDETATILGTIDQIAFQTNLLALNAAVEAARAGEAGAGFAVVADEVRNLAMRSAEAAKQVNRLIDDSQKHAASGVAVSGEVSSILTDIAQDIEQVAILNKEMAVSSEDQSQGIDTINSGLSHLDQVIKNTAHHAAQLSGRAATIDGRVGRLAEITGPGQPPRAPRRQEKKQHLLPGKLAPATPAKRMRPAAPPPRKQLRPPKAAPKAMMAKPHTAPPQAEPAVVAEDGEAFIPWSEALSVKVVAIDQQHLALVNMVNELHQAIQAQKGHEAVTKVVASLVRYTIFHFHTEEKMLADIDYPYLGEHQKRHKKLLAHVTKIRQRVERQEAGVENELLTFLKKWLTSHIMKVDNHYSSYFHQKGIR